MVDAVKKTENREVKLESAGRERPVGMPQALYLNYEEDFLKCQQAQVPRVFSDPRFLPSLANSAYEGGVPSIPSQVPPFSAAAEASTPPGVPPGSQATPVHPRR